MSQHRYPTLPQGFQMGDVIALLGEIAPHIGLRAGLLHTLTQAIQHTRPKDWIRPDAEPVCYAMQETLARKLGKSARAVRAAEEKFVRQFGFIEKRVAANGGRSQTGGAGLVFTPLIRKFTELLALRERIRAENDRARQLVRKRSILYRHAKLRIIELAEICEDRATIEPLSAEFLSWVPSRDLRKLDLVDLEAHIEAARRLCDTLDALVEKVKKTHKTSGRAEVDFRSHIQDSTQDSPVSVGAGAHERTVGKPTDTDLPVAPPDGGANCAENKDAGGSGAHQAQNLGWLTPKFLYRIASPEMRAYVDSERAQKEPLRELHFKLAADRLRPELGISEHAWHDALDTMGDHGAALALILVDAKRARGLIHSPGGYLRGMIAKFRKRELNLVGTLIGLAEAP